MCFCVYVCMYVCVCVCVHALACATNLIKALGTTVSLAGGESTRARACEREKSERASERVQRICATDLMRAVGTTVSLMPPKPPP